MFSPKPQAKANNNQATPYDERCCAQSHIFYQTSSFIRGLQVKVNQSLLNGVFITIF
jgi:hypothetical protein